MGQVIARHQAELRGNVKLIFQPAEERIGGARRMIDEGVLCGPDVDAIVACHLWNYLPLGQIGLRAGPAFASADELRIVIRGRMGHGALPERAVDSVVVAAQVITALQTLVSREVAPTKPAVLTIGTIQGGTTFNVIAEEVELRGTIRAFDLSLRSYLVERAESIVAGIAAAMRADYSFSSTLGCPPCVNDDRMTELVRGAVVAELGIESLAAIDPTTGSDDMAYFLESVPGCYFQVGSSNAGCGLAGDHHTSSFDFDERALGLAARVLLRTVFDYLQS